MFGTDPIASTAWLERTTRPSSQRITTSSPSRSIDSARAPLSSLTPRLRKSSSSTAATSGSLPGSTCWRLTTSVTFEPNDENMWTNSTPVTPDPITVTLGGDHLRRVAVARGEDADRRRAGTSRGCAAVIRWRSGRRRTRCPRRRRRRRPARCCGLVKRAEPLTIRTPWLSSSPTMLFCRCALIPSIRDFNELDVDLGLGLLETHAADPAA